MYDFHQDTQTYFDFQYLNSKNYIIPFVLEGRLAGKKLNVLEIGCAEAGVLKAFVELGHQCTGIELFDNRLEFARTMMKDAMDQGRIRFICADIYNVPIPTEEERYDLILLKDVIEHIPNQAQLIKKLGDFLKLDGAIFFGFPPWQMPFGGHQQICQSKLSKLPYFHLLPVPLFSWMLQAGGESPTVIKELLEIKTKGISIERFERIVHAEGYTILNSIFYLFNPIYELKFKMKVKKQFGLVNRLPYLRNFLTTCVYYTIGKK